MNIALCHFRVGQTDGVSLEMEKWKRILEKQGHTVYTIAGNQSKETSHVIPELLYECPINFNFFKNSFENLYNYPNEQALINEIEKHSLIIERKITQCINDYKLDYFIINNIWSLGWSLPAAIAFYRATMAAGIECLGHHHDFYYERVAYAKPTCQAVKKILDSYFPPDHPLISHIVINSLAQNKLYKKKNVKSSIVPNVFDFNKPLWEKDSYNSDFKERIGLNPGDLVLLQATRVVERKAIELAIEIAGELNKYKPELIDQLYIDNQPFKPENKIVLVMAGLVECSDDYLNKLKAHAEKKGAHILFVNDLVLDERYEDKRNKCYSLWDTYVHADIITYPSILEGWGNQFLEAVFAKKPIVMYEYPVYVSDIKQKKFEIISLGSEHSESDNGLVTIPQEIIIRATQQIIEVLLDEKKKKKMVDHNFEIARQEYSFEKLEEIISTLVD